MNKTKDRISKIDNFLKSFKKVKIDFNGNVVTFIRIEDKEDLDRYLKVYTNQVMGHFRKVLVMEDIDKYVTDNATKNNDITFQLAFSYQHSGKSLPETVDSLIFKKINGMVKVLSIGNILVNSAGGYMILKPDMKIVEESFETNYDEIFN